MRKATYLVVVSVLGLTGCASEGSSNVLNSGRTNIASVQENFRQSILDNYVDVVKEDLIIAEAISPNNATFENSKESEELRTWRIKISDPWKEMKEKQLDQMCELFYQGILDDSSDFAFIFVDVKKQFQREGTVIHSITNIRMREDNRQSIKFPTAEYSSSLFVCSSRIVLKLSNGYFSQQLDSTLAWNYYLSGVERKFTFTFKLRS